MQHKIAFRNLYATRMGRVLSLKSRRHTDLGESRWWVGEKRKDLPTEQQFSDSHFRQVRNSLLSPSIDFAIDV